jgi:dipeptide transport system substrate-binding protein
MRANECQIAPYPNPSDLPAIRVDKNLQLLSQPGLNVAYLGINTSKKPYDNAKVGEFRRRTSVNGEHMLAMSGWTGDNGDPDNFLLTLAGCLASKTNVTRWCNQEYDDIVTRAAAEIDQSKRSVLYQQAQEIMHQEMPFYFIAHSIVYQPLRREVTGYVMSPFGTHIFDTVDLK